MSTTKQRARFVCTPGFKAIPEMIGDLFIHDVQLHLPEEPGAEPSLIVGDPACTEKTLEDGGITMRVPFKGTETVYGKRDDLPGRPVITLCLARED